MKIEKQISSKGIITRKKGRKEKKKVKVMRSRIKMLVEQQMTTNSTLTC